MNIEREGEEQNKAFKRPTEPIGDDDPNFDIFSMGGEEMEAAYQAAIKKGLSKEEADRIAFEAWVYNIAYAIGMPELPGFPKSLPKKSDEI